jgi:hypothetical protein
MALASTTLAGACDGNTNTISVTAATGFAAGSYVLVDSEMMKIQTVSGTQIGVFRGVYGTQTVAHTVYAKAEVGTAAEFAEASGGGVGSLKKKPRIYTYAVAGALTIAPGLHRIGAGAAEVKAMTLAAPSLADDGMEMTVISASAYAHTITYTAGFYGDTTTSDVVTFAAKVGPSATFVAIGGVWGVKATSSIGTTANAVIA